MKSEYVIFFRGLFTLIMSTLALSISAQNITVRGTVTDSYGETVIGATIVIEGNATKGTVTNIDGQYSLTDVPENASLQISYVGMNTQIIPVNGRSTINIVLTADTEMLEEVVVTGYGGVQKAKTMTASATVVNVNQLARLPVSSISEGLGGRVTGVVTQQSSGAPGENVKIWIRGGENILYVIDDVVMETSQGNAFFNRLRPDDIASMSILKDASATAVYGPRAANGVVVIATKRGQEGAPVITVNQKISMMIPSYRAKGLSAYEYAQARNEVEFASFQENPTFNNTALSKYYMGDLWQKGYNREDIRSMVNEKYGMTYTMDEINDLFDPNKTQGGNIQDYFSTYDPWDMFNHTQPMYQTNISLRGGSERLTYYSSLGYMDQQGVSKNYKYNQVNFVLNTDAFLLNDKSLKFTFNLNGNTSNQQKPASGESVFNNAMYGDGMPKRPPVWSTGLPRKGSVDALLNTGFNDTEAYRFQMNSALKWFIPWIEGLSASTSVNFTTTYNTNRQFNHDQENVYDNPYATNFSSYNPINANMYQYWYRYKLLTGIFQLDYARSFDKHNLSAMVNIRVRHVMKTGLQQRKGGTLPP